MRRAKPQSRRQVLGRMAGALAWLLSGLGLVLAFPTPRELADAADPTWIVGRGPLAPSIQVVPVQALTPLSRIGSTPLLDDAAADIEAATLPVFSPQMLGTDKDEPIVPVPEEAPAVAETPAIIATSDAADMTRFLDRLMMAESGGRDTAKNPRSSALGPYQFIDSTFLEVTRRHFAAETATLSPQQILALRIDRPFARRAAEAFTRDNAEQLAAHGLPTSFANLRLSFLLGPGGAVRVLKADPAALLITVVGTAVVQANPFMAGMTTRDLAAWSERNLAAYSQARIVSKDAGPPVPGSVATAPTAPPKPLVVAKCSLALASCRRWLAIATKQAETRQASRQAAVRLGAKRPVTATR